jgi:two-component system sensor histidine kinase KdpD
MSMERLRRHPRRGVVATSAALVAMSIPAGLWASDHYVGAGLLPLWLMAALFFVSERIAFHLPMRRGAHSLTVVEVASVVGVAFASPAVYVAGRLIGTGLSLYMLRRQRGLRLGFNLANSLFGASIGAVGIAAFGIGSGPIVGHWEAVFVTVGAEAILLGLPVAFVIGLHDSTRTVAEVIRELQVAWITSVSMAGIAIITLVLGATEPMLAIVALGMVFGLVAALRSYSELYVSRDELDGVSELTTQTAEADGADELSRSILAACVDLVRSDLGAVVLPTTEGTAAIVRSAGDEVGTLEEEPVSAATLAFLGSLEHVTSLSERDQTFLELFGEIEATQAVVVPLITASSRVGSLILAQPTNADRGYGKAELRLLETLGSHSAIALARVLLQERLRGEIAEKARIIKSKDQLIAAVSHELRTPLTGILGFAEMMRDERDSTTGEALAEILDIVAAEALDLSQIVEDLLTAARSELGALAFHCTRNDLAETADRAVPAIDRKTGREIERQFESVDAVYDAPRVRQIVRNLAANAVRYGGPRIRLVVGQCDGMGFISVRDDGTGVPGADPESVFMPYQSAHEPGTQPGSVGLGLTIARKMARAMGGDLTYDRRDGWTDFTLELPLADEDRDQPPAGASPMRPEVVV